MPAECSIIYFSIFYILVYICSIQFQMLRLLKLSYKQITNCKGFFQVCITVLSLCQKKTKTPKTNAYTINNDCMHLSSPFVKDSFITAPYVPVCMCMPESMWSHTVKSCIVDPSRVLKCYCK